MIDLLIIAAAVFMVKAVNNKIYENIDIDKPSITGNDDYYTKHELKLIKKFKRHLDEERYHYTSPRILNFYLVSDINSVNIDKVINYFNRSNEYKCVIYSITKEQCKRRPEYVCYSFNYASR